VVPSSSCDAFTLEAVPGRRRNSSWTKSLRQPAVSSQKPAAATAESRRDNLSFGVRRVRTAPALPRASSYRERLERPRPLGYTFPKHPDRSVR
jgi:hypothetical protein